MKEKLKEKSDREGSIYITCSENVTESKLKTSLRESVIDTNERSNFKMIHILISLYQLISK